MLLVMASAAHLASATGFSEKTNGVYLAIESWGKNSRPLGRITNEPFLSSNELSFSAFCDSGKVELQYSPDPAQFVKIKMIDENGDEIPKTELGKKFGSKLDDELRPWKGRSVGTLLAWGSYKENRGQGMAKPLPPPEALFEISEPGIYTMEIQFQMFRLIRTPNWKREPITFSPIKVKIEKPPVND